MLRVAKPSGLDTLEEYTRFHKWQRQQGLAYSRLLLYQPSTGLGDAFLGALFALIFAQCTHRLLVFKGDWLADSFEATAGIDWTIGDSNFQLINHRTPFINLFYGAPDLNLTHDMMAAQRVVIGTNRRPEEFFRFVPRESCPNARIPSRHILWRALFQPRIMFQREVARIRERLFGNALESYAAIHVRMGDDSEGSSTGFSYNTAKSDKRIRIKEALDAIHQAKGIAANHKPPIRFLLLACDNRILRRNVLDNRTWTLRHGAQSSTDEVDVRVVVYKPRAGTALHPASPQYNASFTYIELGLLSQARMLFSPGHSGFSDLALLLKDFAHQWDPA